MSALVPRCKACENLVRQSVRARDFERSTRLALRRKYYELMRAFDQPPNDGDGVEAKVRMFLEDPQPKCSDYDIAELRRLLGEIEKWRESVAEARSAA